MDNDIATNWEKTGLLEGLSDFDKTECSYLLENAVELLLGEMHQYMVEVDEKIEKGFFAGCILPIIRRLYDAVPEKMIGLSMRWLFYDFGEYAKKEQMLYEALKTGIALDEREEFFTNYIKIVSKEL